MPQPAEDRLDGWRAIADHLGKSVRTAQRWEEEHGLPVHRSRDPDDHQSVHVFAHASELDAWWAKTFLNGNGGDHASATDEPSGPALVKSRALRWRAARWGLGLTLVGLAVAVQLLLSSPPQPHVVRALERNVLAAYDEDDNRLWTKVLPTAFAALPFNDAFVGMVEDVDGDGYNEVLFALNSIGSYPGPEDALYCYGPAGETRWTYDPDRRISLYGYEHDDTYQLRHVATGTAAGETFIVVAAVHRPYAPTHVAVLDAHGEAVGEYWHYGYVQALLVDDFDDDGDDEILLGGVNNAIADPAAARGDLARQQAFLALIEHDIDAALGPGPPGFVAGLQRDQEIAYIAFPFPSAFDNRLLGSGVREIRGADDGFTVYVDGADGETRGILYRFDRRLELVRLDLADGARPLHESQLESGLVELDLDQERQRLQQLVRLVWRFPELAALR